MFPELTEKLTPIIENDPYNPIPEPSQPYEVQQTLSPHKSTPISIGIETFVCEKLKIINKYVWEIRHTLDLLIQEFGDISLGRLNREMCVKFKDDLQKLPKNRTKLPQYRDFDFHELVKLNVVEKDRISRTTVNNNLGYVSSFMKWCVKNGNV